MAVYSDRPFHLQILETAYRFRDDVALTMHEEGKNFTFEELSDRSLRCAAVLRSLGAAKGDVVCALLPNSIHYPVLFLGAALIGCSLTGIHPDATSVELSKYLALSRSKIIATTASRIDLVKDIRIQLTILIVDDEDCGEGVHLMSELQKDEYERCLEDFDAEVSLDDTLLTPLSSGTSGPPKCVQLTHRNFNAATASLRMALFDELSGSERRCTLAVLPFFHGSGFWALCYCLLEGHRTIILSQFHPETMLECVQSYEVDTLNVVPSIVKYMCDGGGAHWDLPSLRTVLCGSAPLSAPLSARFLERFPSVINLIQGYGMTEVVVLSHITPLSTDGSDNKRFLGSCGKLLPGFEAKVIDTESGEEVGEPEVCGELLLKSDAIMKGYLNDPSATEEAIDQQGWLHTGDLVYFDSEGFYFVVDRLKELIKVSGLQVSPTELEDLLKTHSNVEDAAVVGIPDDHFGQIPCAFVVVKDGTGSETLCNDIESFVNDRVTAHKQLRGGVHFISSLPKTSTGKVIRRELLAHLEEADDD